MVLQNPQQPITVEEFWQIARIPENHERNLELDEGVIVEMASSSPTNTVIAGRIIHFLNAYVIPNDLGYVTVPDGGFKLGTGKARQPDAAFVSKSRYPSLPAEFDAAPDLAVEVVSPNEDVLKKVNEYLQAGCHIVWTVYPQEKTVFVFTLDDAKTLRGHMLGVQDMLEGFDVLPDFKLPVSAIFPE